MEEGWTQRDARNDLDAATSQEARAVTFSLNRYDRERSQLAHLRAVVANQGARIVNLEDTIHRLADENARLAWELDTYQRFFAATVPPLEDDGS